MNNISPKQHDDLIERAIGKNNQLFRTIMLYAILFAKILLVIGAVAWVLSYYYAHAQTTTDSNNAISFEIKKGQGTKTIANGLKEAGAVRSKIRFYWYVWVGRKPLQAGLYRFELGDSDKVVYKKIVSGETFEESITIPEGWRREEMGQLLSQKQLATLDDFLVASKDKEGSLFPDTYRVEKQTTAENIVDLLTTTYTAKTKELSPTNDQLIIASIIEREVNRDVDRPIVAGLIYNRLAKGMRLEMDSTVQYAIDTRAIESKNLATISGYSFWEQLKVGDITIASPYNTYRSPGLPPTPIANPGIKSIEAAIHPTKTDYLFFINTPDGETHFAKTLQEHNQNKVKYNIGSSN